MNTTVAPIVAAVVYKSMYKLLYPVNSDTEFNDPYEHLTENILKRKESYGEVGLRSKSEMVQFSSSLPTVLNRRNRGAHSTRGDDVLRCRPWFSPIVKLIVIRGFSKLFRTYPEVWEHAKPELKAIVIYNSTASLSFCLSRYSSLRLSLIKVSLQVRTEHSKEYKW